MLIVEQDWYKYADLTTVLCLSFSKVVDLQATSKLLQIPNFKIEKGLITFSEQLFSNRFQTGFATATDFKFAFDDRFQI